MSGFTDVFGAQTVPPSEYTYASYSLTTNEEFMWPEQYDGTGLLLASITELNPTLGALSVDLPPADAVSVGRDLLIINVGADSVLINDNDGGLVATVAAGIAKYFYLTNNSTAAGVWSVLTYGAGSNSLDAASLAGKGLKAAASQLETNNVFLSINATYTVTSNDRAKVIVSTGGTYTVNLPQSVTVGDGFWFAIRNGAAGSIDIDGFAAETIDGSINKTLAPNESVFVFCNGANWNTVGYGRDSTFVFTEYVVNAAAGDIELSSSDVAGRMIRVAGTAVANFTVTLPLIDNIYFVLLEAGVGAFTVTFKTAIGTGVVLSANQSSTLYCDGTNVSFASTVSVTTSVELADGSAAAPSLKFQLDPDTGLFRVGANEIGFATGGASIASVSGTDGLKGKATITSGSISGITDLAVADGGTGASTAATAVENLNVDGTVVVTAVGVTATNRQIIQVTADAQTINLPAAPNVHDWVEVIVGNFMATIVGRNTNLLMSLTENMTIDKAYAAIRFTFVGGSTGWSIT